MNMFYVMNGRKLKRYFLISVGILFAVGVIYAEKDNITVFAPDQLLPFTAFQPIRRFWP